MNMPGNYEERTKLVDRITDQDLFAFEELHEFKTKNMLQQGDLFIIDKDGEYWFSIVYLDDKWFAITGDPKLVEVSEKELSKYKFYNKNLINNPFQDFIKRKGFVAFQELSDEDKCDVYSGNYFTKHINNTLDGLLNTLKDLTDTLKEE